MTFIEPDLGGGNKHFWTPFIDRNKLVVELTPKRFSVAKDFKDINGVGTPFWTINCDHFELPLADPATLRLETVRLMAETKWFDLNEDEVFDAWTLALHLGRYLSKGDYKIDGRIVLFRGGLFEGLAAVRPRVLMERTSSPKN